MISKILKRILSRNLSPSVSITFSILIRWKDISGNFLFNHSVPYKFFVKKSELYLACDDPTIATEIYLNQKNLKDRIKEFTNIRVKTIKTVYNINKFLKFKSFLTTPEIGDLEIPSLTRLEKAKIDELVSRVEDDQLRDALSTFFKTVCIIRKFKR
ncbi:MAG: DciA family protein [Spirochaetia bacterium]|nr:DUF721 domain-containing protein [Spirochaetota bacterium]MCX8096529.1 DUF721 domain-containing protein [Spirochaetota bacterium]MDW8112687.1 DciA family protein [Spirochaetia bacterium]